MAWLYVKINAGINMSMLFRNWLEEGYYIEDDYGDLTKTDNPSLATHRHDGYSLNKIEKEITSDENIGPLSHWKDDTDDDINIFSHWKD